MTSKYTDHDILFSNLDAIDDIDDINVCKDFIVELRQRQRLMSTTSNEDTHMMGSGSRHHHHLQYTMQAEDGIRDLVRSRGLGDVYKRQI